MIHKKMQVSTRIEPARYEQFKRLCHIEFRQMADVTRELVEAWIEKNKKKLK